MGTNDRNVSMLIVRCCLAKSLSCSSTMAGAAPATARSSCPDDRNSSAAGTLLFSKL